MCGCVGVWGGGCVEAVCGGVLVCVGVWGWVCGGVGVWGWGCGVGVWRPATTPSHTVTKVGSMTSKCFVLFCRARTGKFKSDFKIL